MMVFHDPSLFGVLMACYFGLIFGSFSSALIYRIPRSIPWVFNVKGKGYDPKVCRSACPVCHAPLKPIDLVPLLSWCFLKGKCRTCKAPISAVYPLAELCSLLAFLAVYLLLGFSWSVLFIYLMIPFLVALLFIDIEHFILPDELVALTGVAGLLYWTLSIFQGDAQWRDIAMEHILGGVLLYGLFAYGIGRIATALLRKDALGFGDVKFFAVAGLWLGLEKFSDFLILSGLIGVLFAFAWKYLKRGDVFPFGPALILSFFILLFLESSLLT